MYIQNTVRMEWSDSLTPLCLLFTFRFPPSLSIHASDTLVSRYNDIRKYVACLTYSYHSRNKRKTEYNHPKLDLVTS